MSTLSPNMSLPIPSVGNTSDPQWAFDINSSLTLVDQHDHSPGSGVQITPSGINISSNLAFNNKFATNIAGLVLMAQNSTPAINTLYESGVDLYYVDGNGNNVQITQNGGIAGSPGSISNLTSPASASYVSGSQTFVWQSAVSIAANMDFGSAILRNLTPNSTYGITLSPPAALSSNYNIVLPALPASQKIMTLDSSGNLAAPYTVDGSTIAITSNVIGVPAGGITATQIANATITGAKLVNATVTGSKIADTTIGVNNMVGTTEASSASGVFSTNSNSFLTACSVTITVVAGRPVLFMFMGTASSGSGRIGSNSNGTAFAKFQIRDVTNTTTLYEVEYNPGSADATASYLPCGALNASYIPSVSGSTNYILQVAVSTNLAITALVTNVQMHAFQI